MIREVPAMTVRQKFGELLNEVQYRRGIGSSCPDS